MNVHPILRGLAVVMACGALAACKEKQAEAPPIRPVLTLDAHHVDTERFGPFTGLIEARYESSLGFQIAGRLAARDVSIGALVKKGQRLAALDPTVPRLQLSSALADIANAQAQLTNATATEERQRALAQGGNTPQSQLDAAQARRDTAQAKLDQAKASLQKAQDQLRYTELVADNDGVVTSYSVEVGQVVSAGQTVFKIARPEIREAVFDVPDALMADATPGAHFDVALQSDPSIKVEGHVREIAPQSDAATRTRRVKLALDGPPRSFRLGTTVEVSTAKPVAPFIDIPDTALFERDGQTRVWVFDPTGSKVATQVVQVLTTRGDRVLIAPSLPDGARIAVAGVHQLAEGQSTRLVAEKQP